MTRHDDVELSSELFVQEFSMLSVQQDLSLQSGKYTGCVMVEDISYEFEQPTDWSEIKKVIADGIRQQMPMSDGNVEFVLEHMKPGHSYCVVHDGVSSGLVR